MIPYLIGAGVVGSYFILNISFRIIYFLKKRRNSNNNSRSYSDSFSIGIYSDYPSGGINQGDNQRKSADVLFI